LVRQALLLAPMPFCIQARLLGERKLKEWPELFTDDVLKFVNRSGTRSIFI
jgi:hypothetical protein